MTSQIMVVIAIVINAVAGYRLPGALARYEANFLAMELSVLVMPLALMFLFPIYSRVLRALWGVGHGQGAAGTISPR